MTTTDPAITIAGLRAERDSLIEALEDAIRSESAYRLASDKATAHNSAVNAEVTAERDDLAAQLAEVRAELAKSPRVCAIHSYEHSPGPCMTCGAWPPGTRELITALNARVDELEARPVLTEERLASAVYLSRGVTMSGASDMAKSILAALGPVTLPAQDRAEELARAIDRAARLEVSLVAPVDPDGIAGAASVALVGEINMPSGRWKSAVSSVRAALIAAGIPVTPERAK